MSGPSQRTYLDQAAIAREFRAVYSLLTKLEEHILLARRSHSEIDGELDISLKKIEAGFFTETTLVGVIPASATVFEVEIFIDEVFSAPAATISVGTIDNPNLLMGPGSNNPFGIGSYAVEPDILIAEDISVYCFVSATGTSGRGTAKIKFHLSV